MVKRQDTASLLNGYLKEFLLRAMRERYAELAVQARQESLSYEQYLLELAEQECLNRHNSRIERNLKLSKIARNKNMETFDLQRVPVNEHTGA